MNQSPLFTSDSKNEASLQGRPLVVDLDGTLINTDTLHELAVKLVRNKPQLAFAIPFWLLSGKAALKKKLSTHVDIHIPSLPFNQELIDWLKLQKSGGRRLILCTASDQSVAQLIAAHLGLFDEVLASDGINNLAGNGKAEALTARFGEQGFDYIGNSYVDLAVWRKSKKGVVVNGSDHLAHKAGLITEIEHVVVGPKESWKAWGKALRLHQWIKNLLIFVPILAAHQEITGVIGIKLIAAFFSFSICASSVYIANDLLDLESDRQHPRKRFRPFASGVLPIWKGVALSPLLIIVSFLIAQSLGHQFLSWLLVYFGVTCAYSWGVKRLVLVDCLTLAILYTLRIIAGAAAVDISLSFWLLAFSVFLFLSLAFVKRYAELLTHHGSDVEKAHGRGYYTVDAPLVQQLGVTSGYAATLVLALYLNSDAVAKYYRTPEIIWCAVPLILLWISWMWLKADRGLMHDDPIIFAIKDKASIVIGLLFVSVFILARFW